MEEPTVQVETGSDGVTSFSRGDGKLYVASEDGTLVHFAGQLKHGDYLAMMSDHLDKSMAARAREPATGGAADIKFVEDDLLEGARECAAEDTVPPGYVFFVPPSHSSEFIKEVQRLLADKAPVYYKYTPWIIPKSE